MNNREAISLYRHLSKAKSIIDSCKVPRGNEGMFKLHSESLGVLMACFRLPNEQRA